MGAAALAAPSTDLISWPEIQARYPYQYVVVRLEDHDIYRPIRGHVLSHGRWPTEVCARIDPALWNDSNTLLGVYYTGLGMPDENEDRDPLIIYRYR